MSRIPRARRVGRRAAAAHGSRQNGPPSRASSASARAPLQGGMAARSPAADAGAVLLAAMKVLPPGGPPAVARLPRAPTPLLGSRSRVGGAPGTIARPDPPRLPSLAAAPRGAGALLVALLALAARPHPTALSAALGPPRRRAGAAPAASSRAAPASPRRDLTPRWRRSTAALRTSLPPIAIRRTAPAADRQSPCQPGGPTTAPPGAWTDPSASTGSVGAYAPPGSDCNPTRSSPLQDVADVSRNVYERSTATSVARADQRRRARA